MQFIAFSKKIDFYPLKTQKQAIFYFSPILRAFGNKPSKKSFYRVAKILLGLFLLAHFVGVRGGLSVGVAPRNRQPARAAPRPIREKR